MGQDPAELDEHLMKKNILIVKENIKKALKTTTMVL
jgi:hypothetical protein